MKVWERVCLFCFRVPLAVIDPVEGEVGLLLELRFEELFGLVGVEDFDEIVSLEELRLVVNQFPRRRRRGGPAY